MEPMAVPDLSFPPVLLAEWAEAISSDAQKTLERMDRIMKRTETELQSVRRTREQRKADETEATADTHPGSEIDRSIRGEERSSL
jgi:hypothetical protein